MQKDCNCLAIDYTPTTDLNVQQYKHITESVQLMRVHGIPFLVSISRHAKFSNFVKTHANKQAETLLNDMRQMHSINLKRGFILLQMCLMDNKIVSLTDGLDDFGFVFISVARGEHEPEIEYFILRLKERARAIYITALLFLHLDLPE